VGWIEDYKGTGPWAFTPKEWDVLIPVSVNSLTIKRSWLGAC